MDFGSLCLGNGLSICCHAINMASSTWQVMDATNEALQRFLPGVCSGLSIGYVTQTGNNISGDRAVDPAGCTGNEKKWR